MSLCQSSVYVFSPIQLSLPRLMLTTHPFTSDTTRIIDLKKEESDALLKFLFDHLTNSQDCQLRVQWTDDTVVIFDVSKAFFFSSRRKVLLPHVPSIQQLTSESIWADAPILSRTEPRLTRPSSTLSMYVLHLFHLSFLSLSFPYPKSH